MGMKAFLLALLAGILGRVLSTEYEVGSSPISRWLIRKAAKRLPQNQRDVYEAEWLQLIEDIKSPTGRLLHASSILLRAGCVARLLSPDHEIEARLPVSYRITKRFVDICGSFALVLAFLPLLILVSLALMRDGPVFIRQRRIGRFGKPFYAHRFRTTRRSVFADDERPTNVGAFLRRTYLDELPQILNVLKGDMSLVGPRPLTENQVKQLGADTQSYVDVCPGMTGLEQIGQAEKQEINGENSGAFASAYRKSASMVTDLKILVMTCKRVLLRRGTY